MRSIILFLVATDVFVASLDAAVGGLRLLINFSSSGSVLTFPGSGT